MNKADDFSDYYHDSLDGQYDCVDRIVLNGYFGMGCNPGGFRVWYRRLTGGDETLDKTHLIRYAGRFSRRVRAFAKRKGIPVIDCAQGTRKHEIAEEHLPDDPAFEGVFLILVAKAQGLVWQVRHFGTNGIDLKKTYSYVNHYSFHIMDREWGHITIKISGHPPFGAQIILNGHEWVERRARAAGIGYVKERNSFTHTTSYTALGRVADTLSRGIGTIGRLSRVCDRWIYSACLCFGLDTAEQEQSGFRYAYSCYQMEYSRNLNFSRGCIMDQVYQGLIDRTRSKVDLRMLKTIFGWKRRPRQRRRGRARLQMSVETPTYNMTIMKIHGGAATVKAYDRGDGQLRFEAIVHNARKFGCGNGIDKMPAIIDKLRQILIAFLNALHAADKSFLDEGTLDDLHQPVVRGPRRVAGIDIRNPRIQAVIRAVMTLALNGQGFRLCQLAEAVRRISGQSEQEYSSRHAGYDLNKLRAKGMVARVPKSLSYKPCLDRFRKACAVLILRTHVIKPVLAGAGKPRPGRKPKHPDIIDLHYRSLQREMRNTCIILGLVA